MVDNTGNSGAPVPATENGRTNARADSALQIVLARWAGWMNTYALPVVAVLILASIWTLRYTGDNLGISTDTSDMLSAELDFRQTYADYQQTFPQFTDTMIVVVSGDTPDRAREASVALADRLRDLDELFKTVYVPGAGEFFERNGLLYLDIDELEDLSARLIEVQAFLGRLTQNLSLPGLLELSMLALDRIAAGRSVDIAPFLGEIDAALTAANGGQFYRVSWQRLFQGSNPRIDDRPQLIVLQPRLDYNRLQPAEPAMRAVRDAAQELRLDATHGVRVQITGEVALAYDELQSASRGAAIAGILSLVLVTVVLGVGLGAWQLVIATVITLLCGLIMTAGFAAVAIGHLNLISIAFAVLYIGLGVHYAVHLCLRYRELLRDSLPHAVALCRAMRSIGGALLICTATTATGFYAFVPTSFTGVSELGLIAGTGMLISLVLSLSLLPALLSVLPTIRVDSESTKTNGIVARLLRAPARHPHRVLWLAFAASVLSLVSLQAVRFDANPINLRDPDSESVRTFNELLKRSTTSPWTLNMLAGNRIDAERLAGQIERLPEVDIAMTIDRFVPSDQAEKLSLIDDLALLLGPITVNTTNGIAINPAEYIEALEQFAVGLDHPGAAELLADVSRSLRDNLQRFLSSLSSESTAGQAQRLLELERSLLGSLPATIERLATALEATQIRAEELPTELVGRWVAGDGRYRIDVLPAKPLQAQEDLEAFVQAVRSVVPQATGAAVFNIESARVVVAAFSQALLSALAVIAILLLILLPYKRDAVIVLSPLMLAALITAFATVIFGIAFNFANVIALPLLLGTGVDNGVHMVHRYRAALPADGDLLGSSTIRAIIVSALTTICSFGNLAFSPHPGAASMGQVLAMGTAATLLCMLAVLPALLYLRTPIAAFRGAGD